MAGPRGASGDPVERAEPSRPSAPPAAATLVLVKVSLSNKQKTCFLLLSVLFFASRWLLRKGGHVGLKPKNPVRLRRGQGWGSSERGQGSKGARSQLAHFTLARMCARRARAHSAYHGHDMREHRAWLYYSTGSMAEGALHKRAGGGGGHGLPHAPDRINVWHLDSRRSVAKAREFAG